LFPHSISLTQTEAKYNFAVFEVVLYYYDRNAAAVGSIVRDWIRPFVCSFNKTAHCF